MVGQALCGAQHLHILSSGGARLLLLKRTTFPQNPVPALQRPQIFSDFQFCAVRVWRAAAPGPDNVRSGE
jgi:hypothetical protein